LAARRDLRGDPGSVFVRMEPAFAVSGMPVRAYHVKVPAGVGHALAVKLKMLAVKTVVDQRNHSAGNDFSILHRDELGLLHVVVDH